MNTSPWRHTAEHGLHYFVEVPAKYHGHAEKYVAGYFRGFLKRFNQKPAMPRSQPRQGESRLLYRLRTGNQ
jgi:hypothetical protein